MRLRRRHAQRSAEEGFSLIELVVVMGIFTMILGIITASVVEMMSQTRKESGQADNLDSARKIIQTLDTEVRYANAVTVPGTGTDGSYYVEWRSGNSGQQQTCTQWRYIPSTGQVERRSWLPPLAVGGSASAPTNWYLEGTGVSLLGTTPIWSIAPTSAVDDHEELVVQFMSSHGAPVSQATNQITLTAVNTASSSPLTPPVCTEVGRP